MKQSRIIVITGSIGSGKSTVTNMIKKMDYSVIDADDIGKKIYLKGKDAYFEIIESFGKDILNSSEEIDRKKLGYIVFSNEKKRIVLNKITHKYIFEEMKNEINKIGSEIVFLDIPIYFEVRDTMKSLGIVPDLICMVSTNRDIQIERVQNRDGFTKEEVESRLNAQKNNIDLLKEADYIISNNETIVDLKLKVNRFLDIVGA